MLINFKPLKPFNPSLSQFPPYEGVQEEILGELYRVNKSKQCRFCQVGGFYHFAKVFDYYE